MPKELEQELKKKAKAKGLTGERAGAYVWGTMRKTGWKPTPKPSLAGMMPGRAAK